MNCSNCNETLSEGQKFCHKCGSPYLRETLKTNSVNKDIKGVNPTIFQRIIESRKIKLGISLSVLLALGLFFAYTSLAGSSSKKVLRLFRNTQKEIFKEIELTSKNNNFLSQVNSLRSNPSKISLSTSSGAIVFSDDTRSKVFKAEINNYDSSFRLDFFTSDEKLVIGVDPIYINASSKDFHSDLMKSPGLVKSDLAYLNLIKGLDLSYTGLKNPKEQKVLKDFIDIVKPYGDIFLKLLDRGQVKKTKGDILLQKTSRPGDFLEVEINQLNFQDWLEKDLIPYMKEDENLRNYLEEYRFLITSIIGSYGELNPLDELVITLEENVHYMKDYYDSEYDDELLVLEIESLKGLIRNLRIGTKGKKDNEDLSYISLGLKGDKYLLDMIEFSKYDYGTKDIFILNGSLINTNNVFLDFIYNGPFDDDSFSLLWDVRGKDEKLSLYDRYGELIGQLNLSLDPQGLEIYDDKNGPVITFSKLQEDLSLPVDSNNIRDVSEYQLSELESYLLELLY